VAGSLPETVLPVCAGGGDFDVLRDTFKTRSGREVALELFVDRGNLTARRGR
jgi:aminopeptidase N